MVIIIIIVNYYFRIITEFLIMIIVISVIVIIRGYYCTVFSFYWLAFSWSVTWESFPTLREYFDGMEGYRSIHLVIDLIMWSEISSVAAHNPTFDCAAGRNGAGDPDIDRAPWIYVKISVKFINIPDGMSWFSSSFCWLNGMSVLESNDKISLILRSTVYAYFPRTFFEIFVLLPLVTAHNKICFRKISSCLCKNETGVVRTYLFWLQD